MEDIAHVTEEAVVGQRVVKVFRGQTSENKRFSRVNERSRRLKMRMIAVHLVSSSMVQLAAGLAMVILMLVATRPAMLDQITAGTFTAIFFAPKRRQSPSDHKNMNAILDKAVARFQDMQAQEEEEAELWRGKTQAFRNLYAFLSQVIPYQDSDLEKLYTYLRHLALKLPKRKSGPGYQFDEEVELNYYRLQKISEGSICLSEGTANPLDGPREVGTGMVRDEDVALSRLIDVINDRFGSEMTEADQFFFDQLAEAAMNDEGLRQAAESNSVEKFQLVFRQALESLFIERMDAFYRSKDASQRVVVRRRNGLELVIMATRAGNRNSHQPTSGDVDPIVKTLTLITIGERTSRQEPERGRLRIVRLEPHQVSSNLLFQKLVERLVGVHRVDHIIAISERERKIVRRSRVRSVRTIGISVACDVQPHPRDVLSVLGRLDQSVNQFADRRIHVKRRVGYEVRPSDMGIMEPCSPHSRLRARTPPAALGSRAT